MSEKVSAEQKWTAGSARAAKELRKRYATASYTSEELMAEIISRETHDAALASVLAELLPEYKLLCAAHGGRGLLEAQHELIAKAEQVLKDCAK